MAVPNVVDRRGDIDYYGEVGWHGVRSPYLEMSSVGFDAKRK